MDGWMDGFTRNPEFNLKKNKNKKKDFLGGAVAGGGGVGRGEGGRGEG